MTLLELVEEVYEKTHVDRLEIFSRATSAWPRLEKFTPTQCALLVRALRGAAPRSPLAAPLKRV
jgi:hypothetical protein